MQNNLITNKNFILTPYGFRKVLDLQPVNSGAAGFVKDSQALINRYNEVENTHQFFYASSQQELDAEYGFTSYCWSFL